MCSVIKPYCAELTPTSLRSVTPLLKERGNLSLLRLGELKSNGSHNLSVKIICENLSICG